MSMNDILSRTDLTDDAATAALLLFWDSLPTALSPVVFRVSALHPVSHQHAGASGGLEDFVYAFYFERRTLLVRTGSNCLSSSFSLFASDPRTRVIGGVWMRGGRPEVGFAANKDDRNSGPTDGANFFYPLGRYIFQRVGSVESECDKDNVRFRIGHWS